MENEQKQENSQEEWKAKKEEGLIEVPEFAVPKKLLQVLFNTNEYNGVLLYGHGGMGKTVLTLNEVKKKYKPEQWTYSNGYTTPLSLYQSLYFHRNKDLIVLDDVEGLFGNKLATSILKAALWETGGERIVQYNSTSEKAQEVPQEFPLKAKIVILCNKIPKEDDLNAQALMGRLMCYEVNFSYGQKLKICEEFVNKNPTLNEYQKIRVMGILTRNTDKSTKHFNFRTVRKVVAFVKHDDMSAEGLFKATTEIDECKHSYLQAMQEESTIKMQVARFCELTGKSRRTFFRVKKEMMMS